MVRQLLRVLPVLAFATSIAACTPPPAQAPAAPAAPPPPPPITQAAVEQRVQDTVAALIAGDAVTAGAAYTSDATFLNARGKFDGQANIQAFWAEALKAGAGKGLTLQTVKSGTSGDLAYTVSRFTGGITATSGHTVTVIQRQADGSLKVVVQVSIPDPPAAK